MTASSKVGGAKALATAEKALWSIPAEPDCVVLVVVGEATGPDFSGAEDLPLWLFVELMGVSVGCPVGRVACGCSLAVPTWPNARSSPVGAIICSSPVDNFICNSPVESSSYVVPAGKVFSSPVGNIIASLPDGELIARLPDFKAAIAVPGLKDTDLPDFTVIDTLPFSNTFWV
ncbi:MAG TPA: hypothetical protein PLV25_00265 [Opitutales bacterium]|nr:hypothetical protein [Opitutales bacterium]